MFYALSLVSIPAAILLAALPGAEAHALVANTRVPGQAHLAACGQTSFDEVTTDPSGHIEDQEPVNQGCELTLCRGLLFEDQDPAVSQVTVDAGGALDFQVECTIPHGGPANVALIDTTVGGTGEIIGGFLAEFDDFCPTTGETPANQTNLQFNLPDAATIAGRCSQPGDCIVQLFWATPDLSQNYYYCKDAVVNAAAVPIEDAPVEDAPVEDAPVEDAPVEDAPVEDAPADEEPVVEEPVDEPVEETTPVEEPVDETPVADEPVDAPVETAPPADDTGDVAQTPLQALIDFINSLLAGDAPAAATPKKAKRFARDMY